VEVAVAISAAVTNAGPTVSPTVAAIVAVIVTSPAGASSVVDIPKPVAVVISAVVASVITWAEVTTVVAAVISVTKGPRATETVAIVHGCWVCHRSGTGAHGWLRFRDHEAVKEGGIGRSRGEPPPGAAR